LTASSGVSVAQNATFAGVGLAQAAPFFVAGTLAPGGRGFGRLTVLGGLFTMDVSAVLAIDIRGTNAGVDYDQLVTDAPLFGGRVDVRLRNGFVPRTNDIFELARFESLVLDGFFWNFTADGHLFTVDRLGTFRLQINPTNLVLTDYHSTDLDQDGIEDAWAVKCFGHTPLTMAEKSADADGDGASNYEEFIAGTDPQERASVLRLSLRYSATPRTFEFPCVPDKFYRVWFSDDLQAWHEVLNPGFIHDTADVCTWTDDGKETGGIGSSSRFYRLTVE